MLAINNLLRNKLRTSLTITGVALAVLSIILLASIGNGLVTTGNKILDKSSIHIWMSGQAADIQAQYLGSGEAKITDSHELGRNIHGIGDVGFVMPILTEMVYVFKENEEPKVIFGLGVGGTGGSFVNINEGTGLSNDEHYNNGKYNGKWKYEALIDSRTAGFLNVKVGDEIHIGKTIPEAKTQTFSIIGLTDSLSRFSSSPMVILYLSELQDMTGNQYYDEVNLVLVRLKDPADVTEVQFQLKEQYPQYSIRTNEEYLLKSLKENSLVIASAASIVFIAIVMGTLLAINTMMLGLNEKKKEIAILRVMGLSRWSIFKSIGTEGVLTSFLGGVFGVMIATPLANMMNDLIYTYVGFEELVIVQEGYLYAGLSIAIIIGLLTGVLAAMRIASMNTAELLRSA